MPRIIKQIAPAYPGWFVSSGVGHNEPIAAWALFEGSDCDSVVPLVASPLGLDEPSSNDFVIVGPGEVEAPPAPNAKNLEALAVERDARTSLWAHIVSEHACYMAPDMPLAAMVEYHDAEHRGPGTIRNHDVKSRRFSIESLVEVLRERS